MMDPCPLNQTVECDTPLHVKPDRQRTDRTTANTPLAKSRVIQTTKNQKGLAQTLDRQGNYDPMSDTLPCREPSKEKKKNGAPTNTIFCLDYHSRGNLNILYTDLARYYVPERHHSMLSIPSSDPLSPASSGPSLITLLHHTPIYLAYLMSPKTTHLEFHSSSRPPPPT